MGYADVGYHGCKDIPTPHLDALAASGVRFTSGYVSGPYCSPTRAGLFYKLVRYDSNADTLTGVRNQPVTAAKLYNLAADIGETNDLAAARPAKVKELQLKWDAWNAANIKPHWGSAHTDNDGTDARTRPSTKGKQGKRAGRE